MGKTDGIRLRRRVQKEISTLTSFFTFVTINFTRHTIRPYDHTTMTATAVAKDILIGILVADFVVAGFHWFEDTYLEYTSRPGFIGDIARDNDMHHAVPFAITRETLASNLQVPTVLAIVVLGIWIAITPSFARHHPAFFVALFVVAATANVLHRWQHERDCSRPWIVTSLQRLGVLCSRDQHASHHERPNTKYGVVLGFTNPVYDTIGIWRGLEMLVRVFTGIEPHPKPGNSFYESVHDDWLRTNGKKTCPARIPDERMNAYTTRLRRLRTRYRQNGDMMIEADGKDTL